MRILSNMGVPLFDDHKRRTKLNRGAIFDQNAFDRPGARRRDMVHRFHAFDDQKGLAFLDNVARLHEFGSPGFRAP